MQSRSPDTGQQWLDATRAVATALLAGAEPSEVLTLVADRALTLTESSCTFLSLPADSDDEVTELVVVAAAGAAAEQLIGRRINLAKSLSGKVFRDGNMIAVDKLTHHQLFESTDKFGPALILPLRAGGSVVGALTTLRPAGAPPLDAVVQSMMAAIADQAALALRLADTQQRARELDVLSERDRIARSLHDHVIQRLFALGLSLQGTVQRAGAPEIKTRLLETIDDVHAIVQDIRHSIFDLQSNTVADSSKYRRLLHGIIVEMTADSGLRTTVRLAGPVTVLAPPLSDDVEAVLREAVRNVVLHAGATTISVGLKVQDDVTIEVTDDGTGLPADVVRRDGLRNLAARAERAGGSFSIENVPAGGAVLRWSVPLP